MKRDVIRIVTPGTILFENSIADKSNNYLAYLYETDNDIDAVLADISTGECWWGIWDKKKEREAFFDMLSVYAPTEAVCSLSDNFMGDWKLTAGRVLEVVFLPGVERRGSIRFPMWRKR